MNSKEYNQVKDRTYLDYCHYLQKKYSIPKSAYFTKGWSKTKGLSRTSEGLFIHHIYEDHAIRLGDSLFACHNPYQWQMPENLAYCDFLEHLFLHILICEHPSKEHNKNEAVGIGGVVNFLVPELNDVYSGFVPKLRWKQSCYNTVIHDKDVFFELVKRFKHIDDDDIRLFENKLYRSYNESFGLWSTEKDKDIISVLKKL